MHEMYGHPINLREIWWQLINKSRATDPIIRCMLHPSTGRSKMEVERKIAKKRPAKKKRASPTSLKRLLSVLWIAIFFCIPCISNEVLIISLPQSLPFHQMTRCRTIDKHSAFYLLAIIISLLAQVKCSKMAVQSKVRAPLTMTNFSRCGSIECVQWKFIFLLELFSVVWLCAKCH